MSGLAAAPGPASRLAIIADLASPRATGRLRFRRLAVTLT